MTLLWHVKVVGLGIGVKLSKHSGRFHSVSCEEMKVQLVQYRIEMSHRFYGLTVTVLHELVEKLLLKIHSTELMMRTGISATSF